MTPASSSSGTGQRPRIEAIALGLWAIRVCRLGAERDLVRGEVGGVREQRVRPENAQLMREGDAALGVAVLREDEARARARAGCDVLGLALRLAIGRLHSSGCALFGARRVGVSSAMLMPLPVRAVPAARSACAQVAICVSKSTGIVGSRHRRPSAHRCGDGAGASGRSRPPSACRPRRRPRNARRHRRGRPCA